MGENPFKSKRVLMTSALITVLITVVMIFDYV
jgi:hypothetical protein